MMTPEDEGIFWINASSNTILKITAIAADKTEATVVLSFDRVKSFVRDLQLWMDKVPLQTHPDPPLDLELSRRAHAQYRRAVERYHRTGVFNLHDGGG
jgi:hypothetical protein